MEQPTNIQVTLNPDGVFAPLLSILGQSSKNVLFGLQLIDSVEQPINPMDIQSEDTFFTFHFDDPQKEQDISLSKENFKLWTLQKGFEDLIKGVNLTLIEAYFYTSLVAKRNDMKTFQDLQDEIVQLRKSAFKQHLPELLAKVKPGLSDTLLYETDIVSLNKVRNCLVHRNGLVTEKDITDETTKQLKVEYSRMKMFYVTDGVEKEIEKFTLITGGSSIQMKMVKESFIFNLGDRVKFDFRQFNSLLTTCWLFGTDLTQKLPKIPTTNEQTKQNDEPKQ
jgi:hypothetical protein